MIGSSGEAVEAGTLRRRVDVFCRKLNVRRPAASSVLSHVMVNEGHVNYDVSDFPVKVRAAPMTGSWLGIGAHATM